LIVCQLRRTQAVLTRKDAVDTSCVPRREAPAGFSLPCFSCGKLKRPPCFYVAPLRRGVRTKNSILTQSSPSRKERLTA
jgi:hypothetical protein